MGDVIQKIKETADITNRRKRRKSQVVKKFKCTSQISTPMFAIIIPAYKEERETLEETIRVLASHPLACTSYHVRNHEVFYPIARTPIYKTIASGLRPLSFTD